MQLKTPTQEINNQKPYIPHLELIEEDKIDIKSLPQEIKNKLNGINLVIGNYNRKPTEKGFEAIQRESALIAEMIQNWTEKDLPEPPIDGAQGGGATAMVTEGTKTDDTPPAPPITKTEEEEMEEMILAIVDKEGQINGSKLRAIVKRGSYGSERVTVGKTTLRKRSFSDIYIK